MVRVATQKGRAAADGRRASTFSPRVHLFGVLSLSLSLLAWPSWSKIQTSIVASQDNVHVWFNLSIIKASVTEQQNLRECRCSALPMRKLRPREGSHQLKVKLRARLTSSKSSTLLFSPQYGFAKIIITINCYIKI